MSKSMIIKKEIEINASKEQVFILLTDPEMTKQYMFGCEVLSNWKIGSPIHWKGITEDNKEEVYVKGEITEFEKGKKVSFTMFDPNMGIEDIPENYVNLTYELEESDKTTRLSIIQGDFSNVENGKSRYEESLKGWETVLPLMKKLVG